MKTVYIAAVVAIISGFGAQGALICAKQCLQDSVAEMKPLLTAEARPYKDGFTVAPAGEFVCDNGTNTHSQRGVCWCLNLQQKDPVPVVVRAEALVEKAKVVETPDCSIFLDLQFMDGTALDGQFIAFNPQEVGWQNREVWVVPPKPIKTLAVYLLYRGLFGCARFRNAQYGIMARDGVTSFDGTRVAKAAEPKEGFLMRDVAAGGHFYWVPPSDYGHEEGGFPALSCLETKGGDGTRFFDATLASNGKGDRAITLLYTLPVEADRWFAGPSEKVEKNEMKGEMLEGFKRRVGANDWLTRYPFAALEAGGKGIGIGIDPAWPAYFRIVYHPQSKEFFIAYDIGLAPEAPKARVRFCLFCFDAAQGFRGALDAYYRIFPDAFVRRIEKQGLWMPFSPISKVKGWEDFGFRFKEEVKERSDENAWNAAHGILTFHYTEPLTWWMDIPAHETLTLSNAVVIAERKAAAGDPAALAWETSVFQKENGDFVGRLQYRPWCTGVVWSVNNAPGVAGTVTAFSNRWSRAYVERAYGHPVANGCDGEYIDSAEAAATDELDFRREHFAGMKMPLSFSYETKRVGIFKGMISFEYIRVLSEKMHSLGRCVMGNSTPIAWPWLAPLLDVMGKEVNWNRGGTWDPMSMKDMRYRRALCRAKPFCYLMNTDFTKWTAEYTEKYMKRSLAFGFFPGFFSADASTGRYFTNPALYERDRPLFKKYFPIIKHVAEAGWEPLTQVASDNAALAVERFGTPPGVCCLTLFNDSKKEAATALLTQTLLPGPLTVRDLVSGQALDWPASGLRLTLPPEEVRVFEIVGRGRQ